MRAVDTFGVTVAMVSIALAGCSSGPPGPAEVSSEGVWGETEVVEELGIGADLGSEEYMLGAVQDVAVAPDGTIYVSDRQAVVIRAYDAEGEFIRNVGREGEGPGEYRYPVVETLPDGRLAVWDSSARRISLFSTAGEYQRSVSVDGSAGRFEVDTEGNLHVQSGEAGFGTGRRALLRKYSLDGELLDTFPMPARDAEHSFFALAYEGAITSFPVMTLHTWSPLGYLVMGRNDRYDIELRKPGGTVHLTRDLQRVPVEPEEREEWSRFRDGLIQREAGRGRDIEISPIPEQKPYFRDLYAGEDGRVWVFRYVEAEKRDDVEPVPGRPDRPLLTWREPWTYDVFEPDGTFLGSAVVPETFRPFVFRGTRIWGALTDEAGIERVLRLRVVPEGAADRAGGR